MDGFYATGGPFSASFGLFAFSPVGDAADDPDSAGREWPRLDGGMGTQRWGLGTLW